MTKSPTHKDHLEVLREIKKCFEGYYTPNQIDVAALSYAIFLLEKEGEWKGSCGVVSEDGKSACGVMNCQIHRLEKEECDLCHTKLCSYGYCLRCNPMAFNPDDLITPDRRCKFCGNKLADMVSTDSLPPIEKLRGVENDGNDDQRFANKLNEVIERLTLIENRV